MFLFDTREYKGFKENQVSKNFTLGILTYNMYNEKLKDFNYETAHSFRFTH